MSENESVTMIVNVSLNPELERIFELHDAYVEQSLAEWRKELEYCRKRFRRIAEILDEVVGTPYSRVEDARRLALWASVPGHPDDDSSGPDANVYDQLLQCRKELEQRRASDD